MTYAWTIFQKICKRLIGSKVPAVAHHADHSPLEVAYSNFGRHIRANMLREPTGAKAGNGCEVDMKATTRGYRYATNTRQSGIGALEYIAIALFFVVVLAGVLDRSGKLSFTTNNVAENAAISSLYQSTKTNAKSSAGYGTSGTSLIPTLSVTKGIPSNLPFNGTTLQNTYGQNYTLTSTGSGFSLTDPGISQADCIKIVVQQSNNGNWDAGIAVNSGTAVTGAIATSTATTSCSTPTNSITFATAF